MLQVVFHDPGPDDGPDAHGEFRDHLTAAGIPPDAIRLAREAAGPAGGFLSDTDCVLITSTGRADIAALAASGQATSVHHLNVPRGGRDVRRRLQADFAARQGAPASRAYRYVAIGTRGDLRWEELERYQSAVDEDLLAAGLTYDEAVALAFGRPLAGVRAEAVIARLELAWRDPAAARLPEPAALGFPEETAAAPRQGGLPAGGPATGRGEAGTLRKPPACVSCRRYAHAPGTEMDGHDYQPPRRVGHHAYGADAEGRMVVHRPSMAGEVTADFPYLERKDGDWVRPDHDGLEEALDWARATLAADSLVDHVVIRQSVQEHDGQPSILGRTVKVVTRDDAGPDVATGEAPASRRPRPGGPGAGRTDPRRRPLA